MTVDLSTRTVRVVAAADDDSRDYLVVADGHLLRTTGRGPEAEVVCALPNIQEVGGPGRWEGEPLELRLYVHGPWVCVTERLGLNAALVDTVTGAVRELRRGTYHEDVSSYSVGFLERDGRTLLVSQTDWNRLDVYDTATWEHLTERETTQQNERDDLGEPRVVPGKNYSGIFHSLVHVSPGSRHFLAQGWVWSPQDKVSVYSTADFLQGWESSGMLVDGRGYNWDRPATFVDDDTFVLALDDLLAGEHLDEEDEAPGYEYKQLGIFRIPSPLTPGREARWLDPTLRVACDVFPLNADGEVEGELHVDPVTGHLVALNARGAFLLRLDGTVVEHLPDVVPAARSVFDHSHVTGGSTGWWYSARRRCLYRWSAGLGIEERSFPGSHAADERHVPPDDGPTTSGTDRPR